MGETTLKVSKRLSSKSSKKTDNLEDRWWTGKYVSEHNWKTQQQAVERQKMRRTRKKGRVRGTPAESYRSTPTVGVILDLPERKNLSRCVRLLLLFDMVAMYHQWQKDVSGQVCCERSKPSSESKCCKSQIANRQWFEMAEPKSQEFPPNRSLGQLKSHFQIARFVIWTYVQIAVRIAMPSSYTTSQNNELFLRRFTLYQIASDLRFAIRITNRNRSQIARFGALRSCVSWSSSCLSKRCLTLPALQRVCGKFCHRSAWGLALKRWREERWWNSSGHLHKQTKLRVVGLESDCNRNMQNAENQESPRQTKPKKGPKGKVHEFRPFLWMRKQARFTLNFCSGMSLRKVHELTFLWFGLPGPLLREVGAPLIVLILVVIVCQNLLRIWVVVCQWG